MTRFFLFLEQLTLSRAVTFQVAAAFLLLLFTPRLAEAQTRPQPVPVALSNVRLLSESADESRFELSFDPKTKNEATRPRPARVAMSN